MGKSATVVDPIKERLANAKPFNTERDAAALNAAMRERIANLERNLTYTQTLLRAATGVNENPRLSTRALFESKQPNESQDEFIDRIMATHDGARNQKRVKAGRAKKPAKRADMIAQATLDRPGRLADNVDLQVAYIEAKAKRQKIRLDRSHVEVVEGDAAAVEMANDPHCLELIANERNSLHEERILLEQAKKRVSKKASQAPNSAPSNQSSADQSINQGGNQSNTDQSISAASPPTRGRGRQPKRIKVMMNSC